MSSLFTNNCFSILVFFPAFHVSGWGGCGFCLLWFILCILFLCKFCIHFPFCLCNIYDVLLKAACHSLWQSLWFLHSSVRTPVSLSLKFMTDLKRELITNFCLVFTGKGFSHCDTPNAVSSTVERIITIY